MSGIMDATGTDGDAIIMGAPGTDGAPGSLGTQEALRAQRRAKRQARRRAIPTALAYDESADGAGLWSAAIGCLWPWRLGEYPGYGVAAAAALGLKRDTIYRWLKKGSDGLSAPAARRMSALLKSRASTAMHLAAELDKYADDRDATATKNARYNLRIMRIEERDGWRSRPRKLKP